MSAAVKLQPARAAGLASVCLPSLPNAVGRAAAVAKFRELADRLESGELAGARAAWSERRSAVEVVEVEYSDTEYTARLYTVEAK